MKRLEHSKSLLFSPTYASSQSIEDVYRLCNDEGFAQLCRLDERYYGFAHDLFGTASLEMERATMTHATAARIDKRIVNFMSLVSQNLMLDPAKKAVEWLIRRFGYGKHQYSIY